MIIWLASYPKSGNTWLRSLIANYYFSETGDFNFELLEKIDSFPSNKYFRKYLDKFNQPHDTSKYWIKEQEKINQSKGLKFFKTHNALCKIEGNQFTNKENTLGVIYIVRDPRNVISSLSNHYQISVDEAFQFMTDEKRGIVSKEKERFLGFQALFSWKLNQKSWVDNKLYPVLTVRYEDLQSDALNTFKHVINFVHKISKSDEKFNKEKALKCIRNCNFNNLKKLEDEKGFAEAITKKGSDEKIKFFNLGKDNDYRKLLNENLINKMNNLFQEELVKYKYE